MAVPQWTKLSKKRGVDPLGIQNSSVRIYQRLLPGISNVTLRMRYYGLYVWLADRYAHDIGDTDQTTWQRRIRRAEALYALIAQLKGGEKGVGGAEWAEKRLAAAGERKLDFRDDTEPGSITLREDDVDIRARGFDGEDRGFAPRTRAAEVGRRIAPSVTSYLNCFFYASLRKFQDIGC